MKIQAVASGIDAELGRPVAVVSRKDERTDPPAGQAAGGNVPVPPAAAAPAQPVERSNETERIAGEVQRYLKQNQSKLDISLDKDLKVIVTKVLDSSSGEVIRQYPPETVLEVMKYLRSQRGMLVNQKG